VIGEDVLLLLLQPALVVLEQLDRQQLALIVPLVHRGVRVEPFVALQSDQAGLADLGQHLGDLGLADAGVPLEQQRTLQVLHQQQRGGQRWLGDVAGAREVLLQRGELNRSRRGQRAPSAAALMISWSRTAS
jgi:hypothetical protein